MTDEYNAPSPGDVWDYPYLWSRESKAGEFEGRKHRPCALAFLLRRADGEDHILLLAITTKKPTGLTIGMAIPEIEKKRANLDHDKPLWIILSERNEDTPSRSYYFEPGGKIGSFSLSFLKEVQAGKIAVIKARKSKRVGRRE